MMIKKPDYCPEWFDLKNYAHLKNCTREQWAMMLFTRQMQWQDFKRGDHKHPDRNLGYDERYLIASATEWLHLGGGGSPSREKTLEGIIRETDFQDIVENYGEMYLKNSVMRKVFHSLDHELSEFLKLNEPLEILATDLLSDELQKEAETELKKSTHDLTWSTSISLDTSFSDELIIDEFKIWLEKFRKRESGKGKRYSDAVIKNLIDYRVLPYIDLYLWGLLKGIKFTCLQIANIIFPISADSLDIDRVDTVRRVTAKKAMELLSNRPQLFI